MPASGPGLSGMKGDLKGGYGVTFVRGSIVILTCLLSMSAAGLAYAMPAGHVAPSEVRAGGGPTLYGAPPKPTKYCPANHTCFTHAHWRSWGDDRAVAIAHGSTYYPGATHGLKGKAKFVFKRPKSICGGRYFTKATWHYKGQHGSTMSSLESAGSSCYWTGA